MESIRQVCIFGGMHGNELSGVHLVRKWSNNGESITRPSFVTKTYIANPRAVALNRRYVDLDLNRQFSPENFATEINDATPYEVRRVQELKAALSKGGEIGECDLVLDLHNTTANTEVCLIHSSDDDFTMQLMHYVSNHLPEGICHILSTGGKYFDSRSLGKYGVGVEVGPLPQGVLRADIFSLQEATVHHALDFLHKFNSGEEFPPANFHVYKPLQKVPYPRDIEGNLTAMIHPKLQDQDLKPLGLDDPVFLSLDGKIMCLRDVVNVSELSHSETGLFYPVFVNEAAYYEKDIAFHLTMKSDVCIQPVVNKLA